MVRIDKKSKIDHVPKNPLVEIDTDHGNKYIISKSNIMKRIAIR
jgi:hypothetical protein